MNKVLTRTFKFVSLMYWDFWSTLASAQDLNIAGFGSK
jgi:hypothetical protein